MPGFGPKPDGRDPDEVRLPASAERVEAEREIVRDAYRRLLAGTVSMVRLAGELNERGQAGERAALPVTGGHWTNTTLARSLTRPVLAGKQRPTRDGPSAPTRRRRSTPRAPPRHRRQMGGSRWGMAVS